MKSIKTKLILSFTIIVLAVTLIIGFIALSIGYQSLKTETQKSLELLAHEGTKVVESRMNELLSSLTMIAKKAEIQDMGWEVNLTVLSEELQKTDFIDIGFVLPNGYTYYTDGTVRLMSDRSYVISALDGTAEISDVVISRITRKPEIEISVPVLKDGEVVGALVGRKEADSLSAITKDIKYGDNGYSFMINAEGTMIAHPDSEKVIDRYNPITEAEKDVTLRSLADAIQKVLSEKNGVTGFELDETSMYTGYAPIEGTDWILVIAAEENEIMAAIPRMVRIILLVMVIVMLVSFGVVLFLDSRITRPLIEMTKHSKRLGELDISKNVEEAYMNQKDEIGTLSRTFHILTVNLREIITELSESANNVSDTAGKLTDSTQQSAQVSDDITRTIEEIARGAYEQARNTEEGLEQASILEEKMETNHKHMLHLNKTTEGVIDTVKEGLQVIDKLNRMTNENEEALKRISSVVLNMKKSSEQIGQASRIISEISREVNLLSLNAAIEAARAGDAGRGFAVVASEIQSMAEQSAESTKVIDKIISELQNNIKNTVESMDQMTMSSKVQHSSVADAIRKYEEIAHSMKSSEEAVKELNISEKEMAQANNEIKAMLQSMAAIAEQNAAGTQQTVSTMEEQTATVQIIADVSDRLMNLSENLRGVVAKFHV